MKRTGHTWRWDFLAGTTIRRTEIVPLLRRAGFDGQHEQFVEVGAMLATLSKCAECGAILAEEHGPTHGGPPARAYGFALFAMALGHGVPACERDLFSREGCRDESTVERRAAA